MVKILREKYKDKESCKIAAGSAAAGVVADAVDFSNTSSVIDTVTGVALMRCYGIPTRKIIIYFLSLIAFIVACTLLIQLAIPENFWDKCNICERYEYTWYGGRRKRRCVQYRPGSVTECRKQGKILRYVIGCLIGIVIVSIVHAIVIFRLKLKIFTTEAVVGETIIRTFT